MGHGDSVYYPLLSNVFGIFSNKKNFKLVHCEMGDLKRTQEEDDFLFSKRSSFFNLKVALGHVGSSLIRDRTHVSHTGMWICCR